MYRDKLLNNVISTGQLRRHLLGEHDEAYQLLGTGLGKVVVTTLPAKPHHEVQHGLVAQHLVANVHAQHDAGLVLEDVGLEAGPDGQPARTHTHTHTGQTGEGDSHYKNT